MQLDAGRADKSHSGWRLPAWLSHSHDNHDQPDALYYTLVHRAGAARFFLALNPDLPNPVFAKIVIQHLRRSARAHAYQVAGDVCCGSSVCWSASASLAFGLWTTGWIPVQFRVMGPDRHEVRKIADQVRDIMRQEPSAVDVNLEWNEPSKVVRLSVNQDRARALG